MQINEVDVVAKFILLLGKSGTGKDTIKERVQKEMPELKSLPLWTSRPMRAGEEQDVQYHFVTYEEIKNAYTEGKLLEYREYNTVKGIWAYGTEYKKDDSIYIVPTAIEQYYNFREKIPQKDIITIYLYVDDYTRIQRALSREKGCEHPNYTEVCRRFVAETDEYPADLEYQFPSVENIDLDTAVKKTVDLIKSLS